MKKMKLSCLFAVVFGSLVGGSLAASATAAEIPTSYVVDEKAPKKNAPAGTTIIFSLFEDAACLTPVDSEKVNVEDVPLRERIKPLEIAGDTQTVKKLVEMRHTFTASPNAGSDLYVKAVASVVAAVDTSTTLLGDCQVQQPAGGSDPGPSSGGAIIPIASGLPVAMTTLIASSAR